MREESEREKLFNSVIEGSLDTVDVMGLLG